jgi:hypothetical protein
MNGLRTSAVVAVATPYGEPFGCILLQMCGSPQRYVRVQEGTEHIDMGFTAQQSKQKSLLANFRMLGV